MVNKRPEISLKSVKLQIGKIGDTSVIITAITIMFELRLLIEYEDYYYCFTCLRMVKNDKDLYITIER